MVGKKIFLYIFNYHFISPRFSSQAPRDVNERVQTYAQPSPTSVTVPSEARVHPVSSEGVDIPPAVTHATPPKVDHRSVVDGVTPGKAVNSDTFRKTYHCCLELSGFDITRINCTYFLNLTPGNLEILNSLHKFFLSLILNHIKPFKAKLSNARTPR